MNILALDLGTVTGYAHHSVPSTARVVSGTWNNKGGRYEGGGMRYLRFRRQLDEMQALTPLGVVYFEEVRRHAGTSAAHVYGGLLGVLTAWCEEHGVPYEGVPVGTIKKFATGRGNASKDLVLAAMCAMGYAPSSYDEADALALLLMKLGEGA